MADIPVATGSLPDGTSFQFFLDGVATYKQNERLIAKMDALVKRFKAEEYDISQSNKLREEESNLIADYCAGVMNTEIDIPWFGEDDEAVMFVAGWQFIASIIRKVVKEKKVQ